MTITRRRGPDHSVKTTLLLNYWPRSRTVKMTYTKAIFLLKIPLETSMYGSTLNHELEFFYLLTGCRERISDKALIEWPRMKLIDFQMINSLKQLNLWFVHSLKSWHPSDMHFNVCWLAFAEQGVHNFSPSCALAYDRFTLLSTSSPITLIQKLLI